MTWKTWLWIVAAFAVALSACALRNGNGLIGNKQSCPAYKVQRAPNVIEFHDIKGDGCG